MKIINPIPGFGPQLSEQKVREFLENSKLNLQLATLDSKEGPVIHPVWYIFENDKMYLATQKKSKKAQNAIKNNLVYYSIDDENVPYIGVKGKGKVRVLEDVDFNLVIAKKIILKYLSTLENDIGGHIIEQIKQGNEVILEISPLYYSAWLLDVQKNLNQSR